MMIGRTRWASLPITLCAIVSVALFGFGAGSAHASLSRHASHSRAARPARAGCKTMNKPVGTIKWSDWEFPATLNPLQTTETVSLESEEGMFDSLFIFWGMKGTVKPDDAANVPTFKNHEITNGGRTIKVVLKKGLRWSNGQPLTSQDVKFSWEVDNSKTTGPYCAAYGCDQISRVDTPNAYTDVFHFKEVYAPAVTSALPGIYLIPRVWPGAWDNNVEQAATKLEQPSYNFEDASYPTNGPFQVANFVLNDRVQLKPMKYYTALGCGAKLATPLFVFYSSKPTMIAAAASKQTDITEDYTPADLKTLLQSKAYKTYNAPGLAWEHFEFNVDPTYNGKPNPLSNKNVRLALALALDKYGLIESALGLSRAQASKIIGWNMWVHTKAVTQPFTDTKITGQWDPIAKKYTTATGTGQALADAKKLIADSPCAHGCTLDFATTSGNPVRQAQEAVAAANWARIGVTLNPNYVPASKFFGTYQEDGTLSRGDFQVGQYTGNIGSTDPSQYSVYLNPTACDRHAAIHSATNGNNVCEVDPAITKAFKIGASTFNSAVRLKEYSLIQTAYNQNAWWVVLYYRGDEETSDGKNKAYQPSLVQGISSWNMFNWNTGGKS